MTFLEIANYICTKIQKTDSYTQTQALVFVKARHKMIYESFDWKAAQIVTNVSIPSGSGIVQSVAIPNVHHVISVQLNGKWIEPIPASFAFEQSNNEVDLFNDSGTPTYYEEFYDTSTSSRSVTFYPKLDATSRNFNLMVLAKRPYDDAWAAPVIPQTENALIEFALADMWELVHQVGKAQAKITVGVAILTAAQQADTPAPLRPRQSKRLTPTGNSLAEMVDSACALVGDWSATTVTLLKDRVRRNWQAFWDSMISPASKAIVTTTANSSGIAVLPDAIDRVISVRINLDAANNSYRPLKFEDQSSILNLSADAFDTKGDVLSYDYMLPVGIPINLDTPTGFKFTGSEPNNGVTTITVRGELTGDEQVETIQVIGSNTVALANVYDVIYSVHKTPGKMPVIMYKADNTLVMTLDPLEETRKHQRIRVFRNFQDTADKTVWVLGKRKFMPLANDGDVCAITGVENFLINTAAADIASAQGKPQAADLRAQAGAALAVIIDREARQQSYSPRIMPYIEPPALTLY